MRTLLTVAAVIRRDDRFLLVEEQIGERRLLNQPAGHVEAGESPQAAVVREVMEETGLSFTPEHIIGLYQWPLADGSASVLRIAYAGSVAAGHSGRPRDSDILRTLWLPMADIRARAERLRSPLVLQTLDDALAGRRHPLELITTVSA